MDIQKQREDFEAVTNLYHCIYNADLNYYFSGSKFVPDDAERIVNAGWKAWQQAQKVAVPDGFVLVPREPTKQQINYVVDQMCLSGGLDMVEQIYKVMIEAQEQAND